MKILLDVSQVASNAVCMADVAPDDLRLLGSPLHEDAAVSVVLLKSDFDIANGQLTLSHGGATVLNRGATAKTVFVSGRIDQRQSLDPEFGDAQFLAELPPGLRSLGTTLLAEVRARWTGSLTRTKTTRKFVEKPDNFWTVTIQPRVQSLALTVRGEPRQYERFSALEVKADQHGYSRFKVERTDQIPTVIELLEQVPRR
jgi:hypothetical protein